MYAEPQQAIMQWSRDENDYVNAGQRSLSRNQERRRSQSQPRDAKTTTRQTTYINQANEAYLEDDADKVQYLQPKKSFFGRVKTMFSRKKSTSAIGLSEQTSLHESLRKRSQSMSLGISNNTTDCIS